MESLFEEVKSYWQTHGVKLQRGGTVEELDAFERRHGVKLPADPSS